MLFKNLIGWLLPIGLLRFSLDMSNDSPPPADTRPMAEASEESARIAAAQADRVLDESKRQYDLNMEVAKPIVDAQLGIMRETERQGRDYYDYMVANQRPVEEKLNEEAMAAGSEAKQQEAVDKAVADSQGGYTRSLNQGFRQGKRYGLNPITVTGGMAVQQAQNTAAAAGTAREKEKTVGYAKKMDVAGLYRGLPGASQGAYGLAINSGNAANANNMAPGQGLVSGMTTAGNMTIAGQGQKLSGLGSVLNAQTSAYNAASGGDGTMQMLGTLGGALIGMPKT